MKLTIIFPAYNEEKRILRGLNDAYKYLASKPWKGEILVVNDGSRDKTAQLVKDFAKKHKKVKVRMITNSPNRGKGYSIRRGMLEAKGDYRIFMDTDMAVPIETVDDFLEAAKTYDVVIGSRNLPKSVIAVPQPKFRQFLGKGFPWVVKILMRTSIKDTQCGFKMFTKQAAEDVFPHQRLTGWAFDVEILTIAKKYGYRIKELPVVWTNDEATKVNSAQPIWMFLDVLRVLKNELAGLYRPRRARQVR